MVSSEVVRLGDFVFELRLRDQVEEKCRKKKEKKKTMLLEA